MSHVLVAAGEQQDRFGIVAEAIVGRAADMMFRSDLCVVWCADIVVVGDRQPVAARRIRHGSEQLQERALSHLVLGQARLR